MEQKLSTKDRILDVSLELFSKKGYDATSVDHIGELAGVKGPAIYRYFKGKEGILDALVEEGEKRYLKGIDYKNIDSSFNMDDLMQVSLKQLDYTLHDETVIKLRKMFTIEQFRNKQMSELTTKHLITGLVSAYTNIFEIMIKSGKLKQDDPEILAMEYVLPVSMLISMVDRQPEKEQEAINKSKKHFKHFEQEYGNDH